LVEVIKIVTISDTHGQHHKLDIPEGDMIIHAGDSTPNGKHDDIEEFLKWYGDLNYGIKILIAGNHDWGFEREPEKYKQEIMDSYGITYLNDSGCKFNGLNIWGSPVQPEFCNWAFNKKRTRDSIGKHWDLIPKNTDILITHGPPALILDKCQYGGHNAGCGLLWNKIQEIKPVLHVFGHIHEGRGVVVDDKSGSPITYCNSSSLDLHYRPWKDKQFCFDWDKLLVGDSKGRDY